MHTLALVKSLRILATKRGAFSRSLSLKPEPRLTGEELGERLPEASLRNQRYPLQLNLILLPIIKLEGSNREVIVFLNL